MPPVPAFLSARAMRTLDIAPRDLGGVPDRDRRVHRVRGGGPADAQPHGRGRRGAATESTGHALAAVGHLPVRRRPDLPVRGPGGRRGRERAGRRRLTPRRSTTSPCSSGSRSRSSRRCRCSGSTCRSASAGAGIGGRFVARSRAGTASPSSRRTSRNGRWRTCRSRSSGRSSGRAGRGRAESPGSRPAGTASLHAPARAGTGRPVIEHEPRRGGAATERRSGTARAAARRAPGARLRLRRRLAGAAARLDRRRGGVRLLSLPAVPRLGAGGVERRVAPAAPAALAVERRSARLFGAPVATPYAVVQRDPNGLSASVQRASLAKAIAVDRGRVPTLRGIVAIPMANTLGIVPSSREHGTTIVTYLYFPHSTRRRTPPGPTRSATPPISARGSHAIGATGAEGARIEQYDLLAGRLHWAELATVALIILIVGIALRAVLAPILTVCRGRDSASSSHAPARLARGELGPDDAERAAGRRRRPDARDRHRLLGLLLLQRARGVRRPAGTRGGAALDRSRPPIVFTAGAVVSLGVASLMLGTLGFFSSFGPGMAVTVATGLLVSVLLVPAVLRLLGPALFWPGLRRGRRRAWLAYAGRVSRDSEAGLASARAACSRGSPRRVRVTQRTAARTPAGRGAPLEQPGRGVGPCRGRGLRTGNYRADRAPASGAEDPGSGAALLARGGPAAPAPRRGGSRRRRPAGRPRFGGSFATRKGAARFAIIFDSDPAESPAISHLERLQGRCRTSSRRIGLGGARVGWGGETALGARPSRRPTRPSGA